MIVLGAVSMDIVGFIEWLIKAPFLCCAWLIIGAMAGALARRVMGSEDEPIWSDLILGLAGAIFGGFITGSVLGIDTGGSGVVKWGVTLAVAIFGAMILIFVGRRLLGDRREKRRQKRRSQRRR
jgi:uncharacterized membrane protein YeaQ/YmgE (transglycosylase-associated protein family)